MHRDQEPGAWPGEQEPGSTTRAGVAHRTAYNQVDSLSACGATGPRSQPGRSEGPRSPRGPEWGIIIGQSPVDTFKRETGYRPDSFCPQSRARSLRRQCPLGNVARYLSFALATSFCTRLTVSPLRRFSGSSEYKPSRLSPIAAFAGFDHPSCARIAPRFDCSIFPQWGRVCRRGGSMLASPIGTYRQGFRGLGCGVTVSPQSGLIGCNTGRSDPPVFRLGKFAATPQRISPSSSQCWFSVSSYHPPHDDTLNSYPPCMMVVS